MSATEAKATRELLKFAEGLWAELKDAGFCEADSPEPWQFKNARAAIEAKNP